MSEQPKHEIEYRKIGVDPKLAKEEKETTLSIPNDTDYARIATEVPTHIKWVLSVEESEIEDYRRDGNTLVYIKAMIPKGLLLFKPTARKSDTNGDMVSYGPNDT